VLKRRASQQELRPPDVSLHNHKKHKILPSPPERGRGAGGEGVSPPGNSPQPAPHKHTQPHHSCPASVFSASSVAKKHPSRAQFWADLGLESPSYVNAECRRLVFTPHPRSPLPFQGRGVPCGISTAAENTKSSPRRNGGEGSGVRGQVSLKTHHSPRRANTRGLTTAVLPLCPLWLKKHPSRAQCWADLGLESPSCIAC
jgi:hypothetical protein